MKNYQVYWQQAAPLEAFFRDQGLLLDFHISGGIPQTMPRLQALLEPYAGRLREGAGERSGDGCSPAASRSVAHG